MARILFFLALLVPAAFPASASLEDVGKIDSECNARLQLPPGGCACIRRAAPLSERQQAFIGALTKNKATRT